MLTPFNRKELTITFSLDAQAKIRAILQANHIDYHIKTVSFSADTRTRIGTFGETLNLEYIFYVHKNDFESAQYALSKGGA